MKSVHVLFLGTPNEASAARRRALASAGFSVDTAAAGDAERRLSAGKPCALVVLDLAAGEDTRAAIRGVRRMSTVPLLVMTARDRLADRLEGLALGATEYLVAPCATELLLSRAWALASSGADARNTPHAGHASHAGHAGHAGPAGSVLLCLADLAVDRRSGRAFRQGIDLGLSATLFQLLDVLLAHRGHVMSRERLMQAVWGARTHWPDNLVTVAVLRLRQRLDAPFALKLLHTVHGEGYVVELRLSAARAPRLPG